MWTGRTASCQNCCRVGQRDKRLVSAVRPRQWTLFRHGFLGNCICCLCEGVYEAAVFNTSTHSLFKRTEDEYIPDAESVRQVKEQHQQPQTCSLAQCFQLYTKEEQVDSSNACVNVRLLIFLALTCCVLTSNANLFVIFAIAGSSSLRMTPGAVRTVSSFSKAASSSVCGPCRTSSYCT